VTQEVPPIPVPVASPRRRGPSSTPPAQPGPAARDSRAGRRSPAAEADVIVVGAGPAGSATAAYLARAGVDVLVLEKATFPREKVCGDGLTPRGVRALVGM